VASRAKPDSSQNWSASINPGTAKLDAELQSIAGGFSVGGRMGASVRVLVGTDVTGASVGEGVTGAAVGAFVGLLVGTEVIGAFVGAGVTGEAIGLEVGKSVGEGVTGASVGAGVVGAFVGVGVTMGAGVMGAFVGAEVMGMTGATVGGDTGAFVICEMSMQRVSANPPQNPLIQLFP